MVWAYVEEECGACQEKNAEDGATRQEKKRRLMDVVREDM